MTLRKYMYNVKHSTFKYTWVCYCSTIAYNLYVWLLKPGFEPVSVCIYVYYVYSRCDYYYLFSFSTYNNKKTDSIEYSNSYSLHRMMRAPNVSRFTCSKEPNWIYYLAMCRVFSFPIQVRGFTLSYLLMPYKTVLFINSTEWTDYSFRTMHIRNIKHTTYSDSGSWHIR